MSAHKGDVLTTTTNPTYEMMKQGGGGEEGGGKGGEEGEKAGGGGGGGREGQRSQEYELVGVSSEIGPPVAKAADKTYEMPSPPSCQPLPTIPLSVAPPTGGDVGVAKEGEAEAVYDTIPGDQ